MRSFETIAYQRLEADELIREVLAIEDEITVE